MLERVELIGYERQADTTATEDECRGRVNVAASSGTVTFPRAFIEAPSVTANGEHATLKGFINYTSVTATGFSWTAIDAAGAAVVMTYLHYQAKGYTR